MNGELAQLVALATHGTSWLARGGEPPDLLLENSTFKFVRVIEFADGSGTVSGVAPWLMGLASRRVRRLWLVIPDPPPVRPRWPYLDAHLEVAFSNAGGWHVLATADEGHPAEAWTSQWHVEDLRVPDRKVWTVRIEGRPAPRSQPRQFDLEHARVALVNTIEAARALATREFPEWAPAFAGALSATSPIYNPDLMASDFPGPAQRLAAMADTAWVFGGMGSWNDVAFPSPAIEAEHREVSRALYGAVTQALVAAVNCPLPE